MKLFTALFFLMAISATALAQSVYDGNPFGYVSAYAGDSLTPVTVPEKNFSQHDDYGAGPVDVSAWWYDNTAAAETDLSTAGNGYVEAEVEADNTEDAGPNARVSWAVAQQQATWDTSACSQVNYSFYVETDISDESITGDVVDFSEKDFLYAEATGGDYELEVELKTGGIVHWFLRLNGTTVNSGMEYPSGSDPKSTSFTVTAIDTAPGNYSQLKSWTHAHGIENGTGPGWWYFARDGRIKIRTSLVGVPLY